MKGTKCIQTLVDKFIDREAIRATGKKAAGKVEQLFVKLGELAWDGLTYPGYVKKTFSKVTSYQLNIS